MEQSMASQVLSVVCAWCNRSVSTAPAGAGVTHTICPSCLDWAVAHPTAQPGHHLPAHRHVASDLYELRDAGD
jgi:hypothetical protein